MLYLQIHELGACNTSTHIRPA